MQLSTKLLATIGLEVEEVFFRPEEQTISIHFKEPEVGATGMCTVHWHKTIEDNVPEGRLMAAQMDMEDDLIVELLKPTN